MSKKKNYFSIFGSMSKIEKLYILSFFKPLWVSQLGKPNRESHLKHQRISIDNYTNER